MGARGQFAGDELGRVRQCAWCWAIVDANGTYVPGDHVPLRGAATHGICPDCKDALVREEAEAPAPLPVG